MYYSKSLRMKVLFIIAIFLTLIAVGFTVNITLSQALNQEDTGQATEYIDIPIEDPYCSSVLGYLLRTPIFLDMLRAELALTESQRNALVKIVREINKPAPSSRKHYIPAIENIDARIKKLLSPFQYVRFRDWVMQHWALARGELGPPLDEIARMNTYMMDFLKFELSLSSRSSQKISNVLFQYKRRTLQLWNQLNLGKEAQEIIPQIEEVNQQMFKSMMNELTSQQRDILYELEQG